MKLRKRFMQLVSFVLVFVMLLQMIAPSVVCAAPTKSEILDLLRKALENSGEYYKEEIEEAIQDSYAANRAGDWGQACKNPEGDNLPWNYFHNEVQDYIVSSGLEINKELEISYSKEQQEKDESLVGKKGRADLYYEDEKKDEIQLWEVKPASYSTGYRRKKGIQQLSRYVNSMPEKYVIGGSIIQGTTFTSQDKKYEITFANTGDGLINYWFLRNPEPTSSPEPQPDPVEVVSPQKDKAKDDLASAIDEITPPVLTGLAIVLLAKHAPAAKSNSVSAAITNACVIFLFVMVVDPEIANAEEVQQACDDFQTILEVFYPDLLAAYREALDCGDQDKIDEIVRWIQENDGDYEKAGKVQPPRDPLIIDLGKEGIELKSLKHGVNFDLDNNGFAEKTAWIGMEDGFLALDRNENGKIDNGGELFGDQVILKDGSKSASGFEALKELDENADGVIDSKDSSFGKLLIWIDGNHNGKTDAGELSALEESFLESIGLECHKSSLVDEETGTRIAETADVVIKKGDVVGTTQISEFWFPVKSSDTTQGDVVTVGNVPDILKAIKDDKSGELYELFIQFINLDDERTKRYYLKKILYYITDAEDIPSGSRGGNIDARDLKVIEQFMGRDFVGVDGVNPNVNAASILNGIYMDIENQYYNLLNIYAAFGGYLKAVYEYEDGNGNKKLELSFLYYVIDSKISKGDDMSALFYDFGVYLSSFDKVNGTDYFEDFRKRYSVISPDYEDIIMRSNSGRTYMGTVNKDSYNGTIQNDYIFGLDDNDVLSGAEGNDSIDGGYGNDELSGGRCNDVLLGAEGNDTLDGGVGNDLLKGGEGNDTYIFAEGYGKDTITDADGNNTVCFNGVAVKEILVNGINDNDAAVRIKGTNDTLVFDDFCKNEECRNYDLKFKDTFMHVTDKDSPFHYIYGDEVENILKAVLDESYIYGLKGNDTVTGSEENDIIYGNEGDDHIHAGDGDDTVLGGTGNDLLDAGKGNDRLYGGAGDDTYLFSKGYGTDVIEDREGITMIRLDEEITEEDLSVCSFGENAVITINNTDDHMILSGYKGNEENYLMEVQGNMLWIGDYIKDGEGDILEGTVQGDYIENKGMKMVAGNMETDRIIGTAEDEWIFGDGGDDQLLAGEGRDVIYAGEGKDAVFGNEGNDHIDGGSGNDYLEGGEGDDTYLFYPESGNDSIRDAEGENTIIFGDGIYADRLTVKRSNWNDLKICFDGLEDTLTLKDYCINKEARNFLLIFADGTIIKAEDAESPLKNITGEEQGEYMEDIYQNGITLNGKDGNDNLDGKDGNDSLSGGDGDDRLSGKNGNDTLDGGTGNDYMDGGAGDDTYIFGTGYGKDTIHDSEGTNTIKIHGFMPEQMKASRTNWNDLTISFDGCGEQLVLEGFCIAENNRNFYLVFDNGRRMHADERQGLLRTLHGTEEAESLFAFDDKGNTVYAKAGNDYIAGGNGADRLYGEEGEDQIWSRAGDDILNGGAGNDMLYGEAGNDTYEFGYGYGKDTVSDSEGTNTISFGPGITQENLLLDRTDWNNLTITLDAAEAQDQLVLRDFFVSEDSCKYQLVFADGQHYDFDGEENPLRRFREEQLGDRTMQETVETVLESEQDSD